MQAETMAADRKNGGLQFEDKLVGQAGIVGKKARHAAHCGGQALIGVHAQAEVEGWWARLVVVGEGHVTGFANNRGSNTAHRCIGGRCAGLCRMVQYFSHTQYSSFCRTACKQSAA